jgi:hypothetical protein
MAALRDQCLGRVSVDPHSDSLRSAPLPERGGRGRAVIAARRLSSPPLMGERWLAEGETEWGGMRDRSRHRRRAPKPLTAGAIAGNPE